MLFRSSGATRGSAVGHIAPEAAVGGPLARLREGDRIRIDITGRKLDVIIPAADWAARLPAAQPDRSLKGVLARYERQVGPSNQGARMLAIRPDPACHPVDSEQKGNAT